MMTSSVSKVTETREEQFQRLSTYNKDVQRIIKHRAYKAKIEYIISKEDLIQELSLVWFNCVSLYNKFDEANFLTYLHKAITFKIRDLKRDFLRGKDNSTDSLDAPFDKSKQLLIETIEINQLNPEQHNEFTDIINKVFAHKYGYMARDMAKGMTQEDIAIKYNITQSAVSQRFKKLRDDVIKERQLERR